MSGARDGGGYAESGGRGRWRLGCCGACGEAFVPRRRDAIVLRRDLPAARTPGKPSLRGSAFQTDGRCVLACEEAVWAWGAPTGLLSGEPRWRR
jgi:hypothetical protein